MSVERKERRRCDNCKEVISDAEYYSCQKHTAAEADCYRTINNEAQWVIQGSYNYPQPPVDVCMDCWEKLTNG